MFLYEKIAFIAVDVIFQFIAMFIICRLIIYPPPPNPEGIAINDLAFKSLEKNTFINDDIIDFYLKYLKEEKLSLENQRRIHVFSSHFFTRLTRGLHWEDYCTSDISLKQSLYEGVKKWTKSVNIFEREFLIVPINYE